MASALGLLPEAQICTGLELAFGEVSPEKRVKWAAAEAPPSPLEMRRVPVCRCGKGLAG